jgi:nucleoside-diphosphate-sugar epimerase
VLVLGGTRFLGPPTVRWLLDAGHEVTVFHRGDTEPPDAPDVEHIHGDFAAIAEHLPRLIALRPEVVLDVVPYIDKAGHGVSHFAGVVERGVVVTSLDVYRAFAVAWGSEVGGREAVPLTEDSPLRAGPSPDLTEDIDFDNLEVERALLDRPGLPVTALRLPMIYGASDPMHRLFGYLRRMDDGRPAIVLDEARASLRWSRGYVENVAAAVGLAVADSRSVGRVFNVAESETPTEAEWVRRIGDAIGWQGNIVVVPGESLPPSMRSPLKVQQDLAVSSERIRTELGYSEPVAAQEALRRTVAWQRENPPEVEAPDYTTEDAVLKAAAPRGP